MPDRAFAAFFLANTAKRFSLTFMTALMGFQAYAVRHHPLDVGMLGLAEALPGITLVLHGGHVADRFERRLLAARAAIGLALAALAAALVSNGPPAMLLPGLIGTGFCFGVIRAYEIPAATGLEALVVPAAMAVSGISRLASAARVGEVLGPMMAGFAWASAGPSRSYLAVALVFVLAGGLVWFGIGRTQADPRPSRGAIRDIAEGMRAVWLDEVLIGSMALDLFSVFFGGAIALLPAFAADILHVGAVGFGFLRSALAAGSLAAALLAPRLLPRQQAGRVLLASVGGFGVCMVVFGLSRSLVLSLAALVFAGACDGVSVIIRRAILRLASPDAMRGRIGAMKSVFVGSSNELGAFESGVAASLLGVTAAVWGGGAVTLLVVAACAWRLKRLRRLDLLTLQPLDAAEVHIVGEMRLAPTYAPRPQCDI